MSLGEAWVMGCARSWWRYTAEIFSLRKMPWMIGRDCVFTRSAIIDALILRKIVQHNISPPRYPDITTETRHQPPHLPNATLDRPFPRQCSRTSASPTPRKGHVRHPSGFPSLPDKSAGFHVSAPSRPLYRVLPPGREVRRRGADITEYSPGSRLFRHCFFQRHSPAPNCLVTRRGCRAVPQTGCRENTHNITEVITLTPRQR